MWTQKQRDRQKIYRARYVSKPGKRERYRELNKGFLRRNWDTKLLVSSRNRAKRLGLEFSITKQDILIPTHCPILGIPLTVIVGQGRQDCVPSLDRKDSSKGYIPGNIQVISWRANNIKKDASLDELVKIGLYASKEIVMNKL